MRSAADLIRVPNLLLCSLLCSHARVVPPLLQVLEDNQMHDLCKAVMEMQSELMLIGNSLLNNLAHLRADLKEEKMISTMY
mmetsp:Transcript_7004/g.21517  ORF Transcript_7004/g.21517 Transcript_7004/m.21517 type:complete len:81 (-) Transcript_7004:749-991(-)